MRTALSIVMPSLVCRAGRFDRQLERLAEQSERFRDVEVLALYDSGRMALGDKLDALYGLASGDFVTMVSDDDIIAEDYVERMRGWAIDNPAADVITVPWRLEQDGKPPFTFSGPLENQAPAGTQLAMVKKSILDGFSYGGARVATDKELRRHLLGRILEYVHVQGDPVYTLKLRIKKQEFSDQTANEIEWPARPTISIVMPALMCRVGLFDVLGMLASQERQGVEIVALYDSGNIHVADKFDELYRLAAGEYVTMVCDDDAVASDYVEQVYRRVCVHQTDVVGVPWSYRNGAQDFGPQLGDPRHMSPAGALIAATRRALLDGFSFDRAEDALDKRLRGWIRNVENVSVAEAAGDPVYSMTFRKHKPEYGGGSHYA